MKFIWGDVWLLFYVFESKLKYYLYQDEIGRTVYTTWYDISTSYHPFANVITRLIWWFSRDAFNIQIYAHYCHVFIFRDWRHKISSHGRCHSLWTRFSCFHPIYAHFFRIAWLTCVLRWHSVQFMPKDGRVGNIVSLECVHILWACSMLKHTSFPYVVVDCCPPGKPVAVLMCWRRWGSYATQQNTKRIFASHIWCEANPTATNLMWGPSSQVCEMVFYDLMPFVARHIKFS